MVAPYIEDLNISEQYAPFYACRETSLCAYRLPLHKAASSVVMSLAPVSQAIYCCTYQAGVILVDCLCAGMLDVVMMLKTQRAHCGCRAACGRGNGVV